MATRQGDSPLRPVTGHGILSHHTVDAAIVRRLWSNEPTPKPPSCHVMFPLRASQ